MTRKCHKKINAFKFRMASTVVCLVILLLIIHCLLLLLLFAGFCMFCYAVISVLSSSGNISLRKIYVLFYFNCLPSVLWLLVFCVVFSVVMWVALLCRV